MNVLLASSETLTFRTYFWCTALALLKLIIHTSIGATIRNFAQYHDADPNPGSGEDGAAEDEILREEQGRRLKTYAAAIGGGLCVGTSPIRISYIDPRHVSF
jgi:hypothetical protein